MGLTVPFQKERGRVKSLVHCSLLILLVPQRRIYFCCQLLKGPRCPSEKSPSPSCGGVVAIEGASCVAIPSQPPLRMGTGGTAKQARKSGLDPRTKQDRKIPEGTNRNYSGKNNAK